MNLIFQQTSLYQPYILLNKLTRELPTKAQLIGLNLINDSFSLQSSHYVATLNIIVTDFVHDELELVNLRQALAFFNEPLCNQIICAQQQLHYRLTMRYCTTCAQELIIQETRPWLYCTRCEHEVYPLISPVMIVAVVKNDKLLMAQSNYFAPEVWSLLAGHCEIGESVEQTVIREVHEEVGIQINQVHYWGSQFWPFPHTLMLAFVANYVSGELNIAKDELRAAGFYTKDELPGRPSSSVAIANEMINAFINNTLL